MLQWQLSAISRGEVILGTKVEKQRPLVSCIKEGRNYVISK